MMVQTVQSTVQVPFDRFWATRNVLGYTFLYIVLALNYGHVFESTWPKSLFLWGEGGGREQKK
jgi:hypothetical protein